MHIKHYFDTTKLSFISKMVPFSGLVPLV